MVQRKQVAVSLKAQAIYYLSFHHFKKRNECMLTKICRRCNKEKPIDDFYKHSEMSDGHLNICKECILKYAKKHHQQNKDKIREYSKKWREKNKEYEKIKSREYYQAHKEHIKQKAMNYYKFNKEEISKKMSIYYQKNRRKRIRQNGIYVVNRTKYDTEYKLLVNLRARVRNAIKFGFKSERTVELLGCSVAYFKRYLEKKFRKGMNWENYGLHGWHIDHIIPCYCFDLTKPEQQKICFNYKNMQPLWAKENRKKHHNFLNVQYVKAS
jgi:hypothetical protein